MFNATYVIFPITYVVRYFAVRLSHYMTNINYCIVQVTYNQS